MHIQRSHFIVTSLRLMHNHAHVCLYLAQPGICLLRGSEAVASEVQALDLF